VSTQIDKVIFDGLTFFERRQLAKRIRIVAPFAVERQRLAAWRRWLTLGGRDLSGWSRFLLDERLTENELMMFANRALVTPPCLDWTTTLRRIFEDLQKDNSRRRNGLSVVYNIAYPVARYARCELSKRLGLRLASLLSPAARSSLSNSLALHLADSAAQVVNGSDRPSRGLRGARDSFGGTKFKNVVREAVFDFSLGWEALQLLTCYPALARLWAIQVDSWLQFVCEFVCHAERFARVCGLRTSANKYSILSIDPDLSDLHQGNRTVMRVRFADGSVWYYKPRSGRQEFQWFNLLRLMNENGFETPFKIVKVICYDAHCWMESIPHRPCRSHMQVAAYYFRAGATLYLVNILRGVDFHAGNLVAHGCQPVLIDCETLSHPAIRISQKMTRYEEGSVLRTGMLPIRNSLSGYRNEASALGRRDLGPHSVRLNGRLIVADQFTQEVVAGFSVMHVLLQRMSRRSRRFQRLIDGFNQGGCRYIYRPTAQYSWMLEHSLSPRMLTNGFDRSLFLYALCRDGLTPHFYIEREVRNLERGDIPVFFGRGSQAHHYLSEERMIQSIALLGKSLLN
jgi:uncharacterized protein DUF4135